MEDRKALEILELMTIMAAVVFVVLGTYGRSFGDTANSRLATVLALTQHGTWFIDRPPQEPPNYFEQRTIDKVEVDGRLLSSKPPMLPLLMTAEYVVLNRLLGWELLEREGAPHQREEIIRFMSMTLIGGSYIAAVIFFALTLRLFRIDPLARVVLVFSLAFCTQCWGYGTNINNHMPAAGMLVVALYFALGLGSGRLEARPWRFAAFGFFGGLAPTMDLPVAVFVALAGLFLLAKHPRATLLYVLPAAAVPVGLHLAIMVGVTGSPLPVQVRKELYLYEASYWRNPRGIDALNEPKSTYLFHMTFGRCGLFSLYPILLAGLAAALRAAVQRGMAWRGYVLTGFLGFALLTLYYAARTNNYGGEAFGFRWYIVAAPVLLLMGAAVLDGLRARWKWVFVGLMVAVSFYSAWQCSKDPWGANREWTCRFLGPSYGTHLRR